MLALLLAGCGDFQTPSAWTDQLAPSGPCYAFNLTDGVTPGDNTELHAAFACLNRQGTVAPLSPLDVALDAPTRSGNVGGQLVAVLEGVGARDDLSLAGAVHAALAAFDDREGTDAWLRLGVEWLYAAHVDELGGAISVNSATSLDLGLLVPLWTTGSAVAASVLDDGGAALAPVESALRADATRRWAWTLAVADQAPDAALQALAEDWPGLVAEAIDRTEDASNDRTPGATGNSLHDAVTALTTGDTLVDVVAAAEPILADPFAQDQLAVWVVDEDHAGRWSHLDDGVAYLASVDPEGGHLDDGEASALVALVRLFHDTNQPVTCSIDLWVTTIDIDLGNLAVTLLQALARIDPDTASSGVDVLGDALGYPLSGAALGTIADSGVCPVINDQFVADLQSLDRLSDPAAEDLLRSLLGALAAVDDHLDAVADVASVLHDDHLVTPVQELVYDLAGTAALREPLAAVPALVSPDGRQAADLLPAGVRPVDVGAVCDLVLAVGDADTWHTLGPLVGPVVAAPSTWTAVHNAHHLLTRSGTSTAELLPMLAAHLADDPDLTVLDTAADLLADPAVATPALELAEDDALRGAATGTELTDIGPLPWLAELYVDGTIDQLWDTLTLFRPLLGDDDA